VLAKFKVFGIGFHKTGTTSLAKALRRLGFAVCGVFGAQDPNLRETVLPEALERARRYDAFQDNPWPLLYREMDQHFPGSKFILTVRPTDEWIRSVAGHFGRSQNEMRKFIYGATLGAPLGNEARYCEIYEQHNEAVLRYFADRPHDLLILQLTQGEGWERLCPFLGFKVRRDPFPRLNGRATRHELRSRDDTADAGSE
jgi:hypothetical protein